ncbi:MAG: adaptor protein MecA [Lachnospiraceae bacterium]|nr:adaptor protein MecA [Lachnospiraceae bacterium]
MKLERLSENQIRCTLNKADLADRDLLLNELAYGTDKAKELFRDMMEQAAEELGFEVNDIPLMIEAIPVNPDCLILIITKVEDPEELDTRFSRLSKYTNIEIDNTDEVSENEEEQEDSLELFDNASSLLDAISDIVENIEQVKKQSESGSNAGFIPLSAALRENAAKKKAEKASKEKGSKKKEEPVATYRIFSFQNINDISKAAAMVAPIYKDNNSLYKSPMDNLYYLIVMNETGEAENYQRVCNLLSEYGTKVKANYAMPYYFAEHFKLIIKNDAIQTLASI